MKIRTRLTAEAVVGGVGSLDRPEALILGRPDAHGRLRVAGRTGRLSPAARTEIADLLTPANIGHPWPTTIPSSWLGQLPSKPIDYRPVVPDRVVELDVDTPSSTTGGVTEHGSSVSAQIFSPRTFRRGPGLPKLRPGVK